MHSLLPYNKAIQEVMSFFSARSEFLSVRKRAGEGAPARAKKEEPSTAKPSECEIELAERENGQLG